MSTRKKFFFYIKKSPALTLQDSSCEKRLLAWSEYKQKALPVKQGKGKKYSVQKMKLWIK
jgi:hypothetical protein